MFFKTSEFEPDVHEEFKSKITPIIVEMDDEEQIAEVIREYLNGRGYFWIEQEGRWVKAHEA